MVIKAIAECASCSYPIAASFQGQVEPCPMCGTINEAISQGVTIPTPLFVGLIAFGLGMFLGPSIIASSSEGQRWLEQQIRRG